AHVRLAAAWTLGEIGGGSALAALREALRDEERAVQAHAVWAMAQLLRPTRSSDPGRARMSTSGI
ncbi:MAG: HEAT repeat domain-containing protein, partial [Candidatus Methylomirabilales bacterium]